MHMFGIIVMHILPSIRKYIIIKFIITINAMAVNVPPAVPSLSSVQFSNDGTSLIVTFDVDTDQGEYLYICKYLHVCVFHTFMYVCIHINIYTFQ
jgi:hypothetical protein